jgi:hypothetical protein
MPTVGLPVIIKNVNTTGKARQNLLGLAYFNSLGFVTNEGLTGMHRTDPATGDIQNIPFYYVPETASWHMATVIATSIEAAQEAGGANNSMLCFKVAILDCFVSGHRSCRAIRLVW